jgi:hypothetical protein
MAKLKKQSKPASTRWDKELNTSETQTSFDLLLSWLEEEGNYRKYKGEDGSGVTKAVLYGQIVTLLKREGIYSKSALDVANKINSLEKGFKDASDWIANTGQGVLENSREDFDTYLNKKWPLFKTLEPVFGDRATIRPSTVVDTLSQTKRKRNTNTESSDEEDGYCINSDDEGDTEVLLEVKTKTPKTETKNMEPLKPLPKKRTTSSSFIFSSPFIEVDNKRLLLDQAQHEHVKMQDEKRWNLEERRILLEEKKAGFEMELLRTKAKSTLLRERLNLKNEGVPQEEIDILFPIQ